MQKICDKCQINLPDQCWINRKLSLFLCKDCYQQFENERNKMYQSFSDPSIWHPIWKKIDKYSDGNWDITSKEFEQIHEFWKDKKLISWRSNPSFFSMNTATDRRIFYWGNKNNNIPDSKLREDYVIWTTDKGVFAQSCSPSRRSLFSCCSKGNYSKYLKPKY